MLYLSGLWGPRLRSMYTKENHGLKFQFILGKTGKRSGSSVSYNHARVNGFGLLL